MIHDYFITKTLDKVRPGGIVAFITTKGTMDKKNSKVREALAQKADLLGAVRLPSNAFKANAGTEVTTDILFFQKRDRIPEKLPEWVEAGQTEDGIPLNRCGDAFQFFPVLSGIHFQQFPVRRCDMPDSVCKLLGKVCAGDGLAGGFGFIAVHTAPHCHCPQHHFRVFQIVAVQGDAVLRLPGLHPFREFCRDTVARETPPADPSVRNFSYTLSNDKLYFRENSRMTQAVLGKTPTERVKGMIGIRDSARRLIDLQLAGADDTEIQSEQAKLNRLYDAFSAKYGLLNSTGNKLAFEQDSSYPLLCSLERSKGPVEGSLKMMPFKSSTICGIFSEPPIRDAM